MPMKNPPHPGKSIKWECLESLRLSVTQAAKILGVSRPMLSKIINERASITPDMAIRLSKAFGSTPETWLNMQLNYDIAQARKKASKIKVKRYQPARS